MSTYVEVPRAAIVGRLEAANFTREAVRGEVTYSRVHDLDPRLKVVVYTSVAEREDDARGCGEDAIRVLALFTWQRADEDVPRHKKLFSRRVYRVTSVEGTLDRMVEAAREAYRVCNQYRKEVLLGK